jgi:hypothetical protein
MKKFLFSSAIAALTLSVSAQEVKSKAGLPVTQEAGDWSISINALPLINYAGNLFNNTAGNSTGMQFPAHAPLHLYGRYFVDANTAYRGKLRIGINSAKNGNFVIQDGQTTPDPTVVVNDERKVSSNFIGIGGGIEKRKGKGRVQGIYGAEALIGFGGGKTTYAYGNAFSSTNNTPTRTDFGGNEEAPNTWVTESKNGSTFSIGLRGFVGVEYFFASKMSIGIEYGWGLGLSSTGEGSKTTERWDAGNNAVKSETFKTAKSSNFGIDTDNNVAAINLSFYF